MYSKQTLKSLFNDLMTAFTAVQVVLGYAVPPALVAGFKAWGFDALNSMSAAMLALVTASSSGIAPIDFCAADIVREASRAESCQIGYSTVRGLAEVSLWYEP